MKQPCVYMMASGRNGTLYVGVTADLIARASQHRAGCVEGFTKQYGVNMLVWFEFHETMAEAITREKAIKNWKRMWKADLIQSSNPYWLDLYPGLV
ncbi:MAG: GIY-YIG nuclease family protein [Pseudoxanthomonas sp.]